MTQPSELPTPTSVRNTEQHFSFLRQDIVLSHEETVKQPQQGKRLTLANSVKIKSSVVVSVLYQMDKPANQDIFQIK